MIKVFLIIATTIIGVTCLYFGLMILTCLPRKEKPRDGLPIIACIGDSITFGMGVNWTRKRDCWVRRLEKLLDGKYQVLNYGICGATLQREGDVPYRKRDFMEYAKGLHPEIFILMLGTNDSKPYNWNAERYENELAEIIMEMKNVTSVKKVFVMAPPFAVPKKGKAEVAFDIKNEVIRNEIRPIVKRLTDKHNVSYIDLYLITDKHPEYYKDGVHPNAVGNEVIAEYISNYIVYGSPKQSFTNVDLSGKKDAAMINSIRKKIQY